MLLACDVNSFCSLLKYSLKDTVGRRVEREPVAQGATLLSISSFDCVLVYVCAFFLATAVSHAILFELANLTAKDLGVAVLLVFRS